jgi:hypothetical protein
MTWIIAQNPIYHNLSNTFAVSNHVDPESGEHKVVAIVQIVNPGEWFDGLPDDEAAGLIAAGVARAPTAAELRLRQMSEGGR